MNDGTQSEKKMRGTERLCCTTSSSNSKIPERQVVVKSWILFLNSGSAGCDRGTDAPVLALPVLPTWDWFSSRSEAVKESDWLPCQTQRIPHLARCLSSRFTASAERIRCPPTPIFGASRGWREIFRWHIAGPRPVLLGSGHPLGKPVPDGLTGTCAIAAPSRRARCNYLPIHGFREIRAPRGTPPARHSRAAGKPRGDGVGRCRRSSSPQGLHPRHCGAGNTETAPLELDWRAPRCTAPRPRRR
jgi:hypothetical protein